MERKYKVGDVVLIRARIIDTDTNDEFMHYRGETNGELGRDCWFGENDVFALVSSAEPRQEPKKSARLTVGDWVKINHEDREVIGEIIVDDLSRIPYYVRISEVEGCWRTAEHVTRAEAPKKPEKNLTPAV